MLDFRLSISAEQREQLRKALDHAHRKGDLREAKRLLAILAFAKDERVARVAELLQVTAEAVRQWIKRFLLGGVIGMRSKHSPGRPPKLTKKQRRELAALIEAGPAEAGYVGNCWRSPMIQQWIQQRFGVFYSVHYISQLLKNLGFSYQKARFVSDHLDQEARLHWLETQWPNILAEAKQQHALLLFGDEASFPQWGSLSYTWARKGQQPTIKTAGIRKGYKVLGLIDYFTGRFFYKCQEARLNSHTYIAYLTEVLEQTHCPIILVQDGAPYHKSAALKAFFKQHQARLTVYQLPSYSPDYNPIEKLWKKVKEKGTHLHYFPTFDDLKRKVEQSLLLFKNAAEEILSLFVKFKELAATA